VKDGEVVCNKCLGEGEILLRGDHFGVELCPKCLGVGKLDWIENVVGKKIVEFDIEPIDFDIEGIPLER
jgi:hypothetical protein